jgi:F-type H+-transporting ATPase subunit epsilon
MNLAIITPDKEIFHGKVKSVNVPAADGRMQILKGHAPIVAALGKGEVRYELMKGEKKSLQIEQGFMEVLRDDISLLVTGVLD